MSEITQSDLINKIVNDGRYKSICKKLTGVRTHLADDLYQETMLTVLETPIGEIKKWHSGGYIEFYIQRIASSVWKKRNRVKYHEDGCTSVLMEYSSSFNVEANKENSCEDGEFTDKHPLVRRVINQESIDYNPKADVVFEATKKILKEDCNSNELQIRYMARVYNYSNNNIAGLEIKDGLEACENANKFAASSGINYPAVSKVCRKYRNILQDKLKPLMND